MLHTYLLSRLLAAPLSRKPFAKGLLSIFNWVIYQAYRYIKSKGGKKTKDIFYLFILVCSNSNELCFFEYESFNWWPWYFNQVIRFHDVQSWLITMHRIEYCLKRETESSFFFFFIVCHWRHKMANLTCTWMGVVNRVLLVERKWKRQIRNLLYQHILWQANKSISQIDVRWVGRFRFFLSFVLFRYSY